MPSDILDGIAKHGIRNALLTSIAPTGTISLLAGNVSSGIEPIFALEYVRRLKLPDGGVKEELLTDYAVRLYRELKGADTPLPDVFVTVEDLHWRDHLRMQAALQAHVDSAISKTINLPEDIPFEEFRDVYHEAWMAGLKGCTTYRPNPITGAVLQPVREEREETPAQAAHGAQGEPARQEARANAAANVAANTAAQELVPETDLSSDVCDGLVCTLPPPKHTRHADVCPECGERTLVHVEGCEKCLSCDYDKCG
jgi:ribonucleoside-diphosphate reductase alpha chain